MCAPGSKNLDDLEPLDAARRVDADHLADAGLHERLAHRAVGGDLDDVVLVVAGGLADEAVELAVGPGETVQSVSLNRGSLAIHVRRPDGSDAIIVYSLARQGVVQRLNIKPQ